MMETIEQWLEIIPSDAALWLAVCAFVTLDVALGVIKAAVNGNLSSVKAREAFFTRYLSSRRCCFAT